jgi:hypothetical protein
MINGLAQATQEKLFIQLLFSAGYPTCDNLGLRVVDRYSQWPIFEVLECDKVAGFGIPEGFLDFRRIDPLVTVEDARAGFDDEAWHGGRKGHAGEEIKTWRSFSLEHPVDGDYLPPELNPMGQNLKTRQKRRRRKLYLKRKNERIKAGASAKPAKADKPAKKAAKKTAKKAAKKAAKKVAKKAAKPKAEEPKSEEPKAEEPKVEEAPAAEAKDSSGEEE